MRYRYILVGLLVFVTVVSGAYAATPQQCAVLKGAGFSGVCDARTVITGGDVKLGISNGVAAAKGYLTSKASNLRNSKAPVICPGNKNIGRLNNTFAVCAANFIKAYESVYGGGSVVIVSGYRPGAEQSDGCGNNKAAGGATNSNHTKGLAMDVNPRGNGSYKTLYNFARKNPSLGVCFPHYGWDNPHLTLAGGSGGEARKCASQGVTRACSGAPKFDPNQQAYSQDVSGKNIREIGNSQKQPTQTSQPPPSRTSQTPSSSNNSNTGSNSIWSSKPKPTDASKNAATLTCKPGTISGTERALIEWSCGDGSTHSRGATTSLKSRFNTQGRLGGRGYARPGESVSYKVQCVAGSKVVGEATCRVNVSGDSEATSAQSSTASANSRVVLHLSTEVQTVDWGTGTSLQWASIGADNCTVTGNNIKKTGKSGSVDTGKLYSLATYILKCDTTQGSKSIKAEVRIR